MSRRIPGLRPVLVGSATLRSLPVDAPAHLRAGPTATAVDTALRPTADGSAATVSLIQAGAAAVPRSLNPVADPPQVEVDDLWSAFLAAPSGALRDRLVVHYTPLVRSVAHRIVGGLPS